MFAEPHSEDGVERRACAPGDAPTMERLEERLLLSGCVLRAGAWLIVGDADPANAADEIVIRRSTSQADTLEVAINGEVVDARPEAWVRRIAVWAGEGDDVVRVELDGLAWPRSVVLFGQGGDDVLAASGGNDTLVGGDGDDRLDGGDGHDRLYGGAGDDQLAGGDGIDVLLGGDGDDRLDGGPGHDVLLGGLGDDELAGGDGHDRLYGGLGADSLDGGAGDDRLYAGGFNANTLVGGPGSDLLVGSYGDDVLAGGDGDDRLYGGWGDDILKGDPGSDLLHAGPGNDLLDGGDGGDVLIGRVGSNQLYGDSQQDRLISGALDVLVDESFPGLLRAESGQRSRQMWIAAALERYGELFGRPYDGASSWEYGTTLGRLVNGPVTLADLASLNAAEAGGDYSGTNTQEAGVDEADLVKTDGERLYLISNGELVIIDADPADGLEILARVPIEGTACGLYLYGDRVTILSRLKGRQVQPTDPIVVLELTGLRPVAGQLVAPPVGSMVWVQPTLYPWARPSDRRVKVTVLDVSDPAAPQTVEESCLDGRLVDSRALDDRVIVVVRNDFSLPRPVLREAETGTSVYEDAASYLRRLNDWLAAYEPGYTAVDAGGAERAGSFVDAGSFMPNGWTDENLLSVVSFDVDDDESGPEVTTSVVGVDGEVYASTESLYVVGRSWQRPAWGTPGSPTWTSDVHKFDLTDREIPLTASGWVPGHVLNQFSMDEEGGFFRIATHERSDGRQSNNVFVLGQRGHRLNVVGSLRGLAVGERIYSARFLGDRGFLVTFRKLDPLFTLDLADPTAPKVVGELKVPGYSTYLHLADSDHVLGLGRDVDPDRPQYYRDLQLSLFDVSDFAEPARVDLYQFNESRSDGSEAENEHHAFSLFSAYGILALPVRSDYGEPAALHVFEVDVETGFRFLGEIQHETSVRRSLRIGELLYSISSDTVKVHWLTDPGMEVASVTFPEAGAL